MYINLKKFGLPWPSYSEFAKKIIHIYFFLSSGQLGSIYAFTFISSCIYYIYTHLHLMLALTAIESLGPIRLLELPKFVNRQNFQAP
jgi:hypothetical protein